MAERLLTANERTLHAEVAELRKDAQRLDWLDANHSSVSFAQGYLGKPASWGAFNIQTAAWATGFDNVRAAIDAARASLLDDKEPTCK